MYGLYRKEVFTLDELPPELRERAMLDQFIDLFLAEPDKRLEDFGNIKDLRNYRIAARRYAKMVAELVRRGNVELADIIFRTVLAHLKDADPPFPERPKAAREAFNILAQPMSLDALIDSLVTAGKEDREKLAALIYAAGPASTEHIIDLLGQSEDRSLRHLLCKILTRFGDRVTENLANRVRDPDTPWYLARNLVMVMGDSKSGELVPDADDLLSRPDPRVREETLIYLAKVRGTESEPYLVRHLGDEDPAVRRRAVRILSRFPGLSEAAVAGVAALASSMPAKAPGPEEEQAVSEAAALLARQGNVVLPGGRTAEQTLAEALEAEAGKGLLGRLTGPKSNRTPAIKAALAEALAEVGSDQARKALAGLQKDKDPAVKEAVQLALAKLGEKG